MTQITHPLNDVELISLMVRPPRVRGMAPLKKTGNDMNNDIRELNLDELNLNELDIVSGGWGLGDLAGALVSAVGLGKMVVEVAKTIVTSPP